VQPEVSPKRISLLSSVSSGLESNFLFCVAVKTMCWKMKLHLSLLRYVEKGMLVSWS